MADTAPQKAVFVDRKQMRYPFSLLELLLKVIVYILFQ